MTSVNEIVSPGTIVRARLLLGGVLVCAAAVTWGIGLTLDPTGKAVVAGTEHVRSTVVTFKRNGAIGTLILCAIASWLLFPRWRTKQPIRDWALIALLSLLAGSGIYTLLALRPSASELPKMDENLATTYGNLNTGMSGDTASPGVNMAPTSGRAHFPARGGIVAEQPVERAARPERMPSVDPGRPTDRSAETNDIDSSDLEEPANTAAGENRD